MTHQHISTHYRKHRYPTRSDAVLAVREMQANDPDGAPFLSAYECQFGDHWHIGNVTGRDRRRVLRRIERIKRKAMVRSEESA